ncbi:MAG: hypothetical protein K0Q63_2402, partial [Paenibacillus sp.]|nr:hypothetical protein [Paenibacillus sp.]
DTQERLYLLASTSKFIRAALIYMPSIDRVLTSSMSIDALDKDEYDAIARGRDRGQVLAEQDGQLYINDYYPDPLYYKRGSAYISRILLNRSEITKTLASAHAKGNSFAVLRSDSEGWSATSRSNDLPAAQSIALAIESARPEGLAPGETAIVDIDGEAYWMAYGRSPSTSLTMAVFVPEGELVGELRDYERWIWVLSIASLAVILFFSGWMFRMIHQPMSGLISSLRKVEKGMLEKIPVVRRRGEFAYLYRQYNAMIDQLKVLIHEVYEQKIRTQSSELKQLQSQINPHFLYNTYFVMYRLAKMGEIDKIVAICELLGNYFQYITRSAPEGAVPLSEEIAHSRTYVDIQQIRFSNRIVVTFEELPAGWEDILVPKLVVQPLLENAYKYGMEMISGDGRIRVWFEEQGDKLAVHIEDNGIGMNEEEMDSLRLRMSRSDGEVETTGLINVHRRLRLKLGSGGGLAFHAMPEGGLRVTLHIDRGATGHEK